MSDVQTFKAIIHNTLLVAVDLCLVCNDQILLGKRMDDRKKNEKYV